MLKRQFFNLVHFSSRLKLDRPLLAFSLQSWLNIFTHKVVDMDKGCWLNWEFVRYCKLWSVNLTFDEAI